MTMTETTWTSIRDVLGATRPPTPEEQAITADVMSIARDVQDGMPIEDARLHITARDMFVCRRFTPFTGPDHEVFQAMMDGLVRTQEDQYGKTYTTNHGLFSDADLRAAHAHISRTSDDQVRILFPCLVPWKYQPNPEAGYAGERGNPVYGQTAEEREQILSIRPKTKRERKSIFEDI